MPRETDRFREYVEPLDNNSRWKCKFCGKEYSGSATRIKAHLAGLERYGIHGCEVVEEGVRSEAQKALTGKGPMDSSSESEGNVQGSSYPHLISSSLTQGPHQPMTGSNEDGWRETSFATMPNLSSEAMSTLGARSSTFVPLHETNVSSQSLPAQIMISQQDFSFWTQPPQSHSGDSYIQLRNLHFPSSGGDLVPEALTNMPCPMNADEGERNTEAPQDARTDDALVDNQPSICEIVDEDIPILKRKLEELSSREADMDELETWCRKVKRIKGEYWSMVQAFREGRSLSLQQTKRVDNLSREVEEILLLFNLKKVEAFHCSVPNVETFNAFVRFLEQTNSQQYELVLNVSRDYFFRDIYKRHIFIESCHSIAARVAREVGGDGRALLPKNVQVLKVGRCGEVTSLCKVGPLDNLEWLEIEEWEKLEELGAIHFPHLQKLCITGCSKLKHLWEEGQGLPCLIWFEINGSEELEGINIAAPRLQWMEVSECHKMKRVVEWEWLTTRLPNLKDFKIYNCEKLEEIIGGPLPSGATCLLKSVSITGCNNMKRVLLTEDMLLHLPFLQDIIVKDCKGVEVIIGAVHNMTHFSFPNLKDLTLKNLPELKCVCDGTMTCDFIQWITIKKCPKLKRIPLLLHLLDNELPSPLPSLQKIWINWRTWESLEWDHPFARSSLQDFVLFLDDKAEVDPSDEDSSSDSGGEVESL